MKRISMALAVMALMILPALASAQIENPEAGQKYNEGVAQLRQGNYQEAISLLTESARLEPNNYLANYALGLCQQRLRNAEQAIQHYDAAAEFNPNYFDAYFAKGNVYKDLLNDPDQAIEAYQMAGSISERLGQPKWEAFFNMGVLLFQQQRFDEALTAFGKTVQTNPTNERAYVSMGRIYLERGDYETALVNFTQASQVRPNWFEPYFFKATALNGLGQYDQAIAEADAALQRMPGHGGALFEKGTALQRLERWDEAIAVFTEAARDAQWRQMANHQIELIKNRDKYVDIPPALIPAA
jgi:tetratricopeptide (TPR) repeat protein